jgi:hypothetical protein
MARLFLCHEVPGQTSCYIAADYPSQATTMTTLQSALLAVVAMSLLALNAQAQAPTASPAGETVSSGANANAAKPAAPPHAPITYGGGDGTSCDKAIVIQGATGEHDGVRSEYIWLREHVPGYKMIRQAAVNGKGRVYDRLDYTDKDGAQHSTCFDITAFYGKF